MLGFSPYSSASIADIGFSELLVVPVGVSASSSVGSVRDRDFVVCFFRGWRS